MHSSQKSRVVHSNPRYMDRRLGAKYIDMSHLACLCDSACIPLSVARTRTLGVKCSGLLALPAELLRAPLISALLVVTLTAARMTLAAETDGVPPKQGAELLKTDILGVFAHPDDETGVAATLAYYAVGKGKVVANIYCTRGEGGGNMVGTQSGAALGILRE